MKNLRIFGNTAVKLFALILLATLSFPTFGAGKEKVIRSTMNMDIDGLNPYKIVSSASEEVTWNVFEGLVKPSETGGIKPAVAESYTVSDDGLTYTFKIRKGIKFHNGNPLDIKDVEYSLNVMTGRTGEKMASVEFELVDKIVVKSEDEISIVLKQPNVSFIYAMIEGIVPDENAGNLDKKAIGTGPYKISEYEREYGLVLERFDDYWGEKPQVTRVELVVTPDAEIRFLKLLSGEINLLASGVDAKRLGELKNQEIVNGPQNLVQLLALNHKFKPFSDKRVREAINLAIDKKKLIEIMGGQGIPLETNMSPVMKDVYVGDIGQKVDPARAKALLKEAGYENLKFTVRVPSNYAYHVNTAQVIVEQLKEIGVVMQIETIEWATWLDDVYAKRNFEATIIGFSGKLDPDAVLRRYTSDYERNMVNYENPEYDKLIKTAKVTVDDAARIAMYKKAQEILRDDFVSVFITDPGTMIAVQKGIKGYVIYPIPFVDYSKLIIED
ncbi:MAG: ABC transporter substrate-binding protein [Fusobacteriaceae bacterium]|jgi:peptide/nickel transport system substrate-binding protein|nr:ABC transporter substrate-binding protein [Fusobacteriaceae bacterium]